MKILWLASWYPSELSPFNGDFIQRHAAAAALYNDIDVIYAERDEKGVETGSVKKKFTETGKLREQVIYYFIKNRIPVFSKILSSRVYRREMKKAIRQYIAEHGKPDLVHVHVAMKAGLAALWMKSAFGIPYVVTEHWTGYLPEAKPSLTNQSVFYRAATRKILRGAVAVSAVSQYLAEHLKNFTPKPPVVIPNVVDTTRFNYLARAENNCRFVHISGLDYQKDPETLFQAIRIAAKQQKNIRLDVFGNRDDSIRSLVRSMALEDHVTLHGEVSQQLLAQSLRSATALILPSRYETFGCVIIEANASGLPVIVSDLPVLHEIVQDGVNGSFVQPGNAEQLAAAILVYCRQETGFDREKIAATTASRFDYRCIGAAFDNWYRSVINRIN